ncbi:MAG: hypothetical protein LC640_05195, partial [Frankia sp.]|nr:hypothetical protein [Frankia sp.]
ETDPEVFRTLLNQAHTAATRFTTDSALRRRLADAAGAARLSAEPGSDLQLVWTRAWVDATDDADPLRALLDGPVTDLWSSRSPEIARILAARLYPAVIIEQSTLDRSDAFLADESLPAGLRRIVLEQRDDVRRALAARAV